MWSNFKSQIPIFSQISDLPKANLRLNFVEPGSLHIQDIWFSLVSESDFWSKAQTWRFDLVLPVFMHDKASERCRPVPDLPKLQNSEVEELPKLLRHTGDEEVVHGYRRTGADPSTRKLPHLSVWIDPCHVIISNAMTSMCLLWVQSYR